MILILKQTFYYISIFLLRYIALHALSEATNNINRQTRSSLIKIRNTTTIFHQMYSTKFSNDALFIVKIVEYLQLLPLMVIYNVTSFYSGFMHFLEINKKRINVYQITTSVLMKALFSQSVNCKHFHRCPFLKNNCGNYASFLYVPT